MRIDTRPRKRNAPRPAEKAAPGFLQWLRGRDCFFVFAGGCDGRMEAMHLDFAGDKGMGTKVSDRYSLPCCSHHHAEQHQKGWDTFAASKRQTKNRLLDASGFYWFTWPGRPAWERKLER